MMSITTSILSILLIILLFFLLIISLKIDSFQFFSMKFDFNLLAKDISFSFLRVTIAALAAVIMAVFSGKLIALSKILHNIFIPLVNFVRHISPYAWLPFALIWFGLGEKPAAFIMFIALFFPAVIMTVQLFEQIPPEYREEASILGADEWQIFKLIEIPLLKNQILNLFRVLWGLGFTTVIAVEMLGVENGLGFRLLDLRYLLKYKEMVIYLITMGITGILVDKTLSLLDK